MFHKKINACPGIIFNNRLLVLLLILLIFKNNRIEIEGLMNVLIIKCIVAYCLILNSNIDVAIDSKL
jgi:hypothetical protein